MQVMAGFIGEVGLAWRDVARVAGGAGGIRTLDRPLQAYNGLANRRLQPLGHSSIEADMPDTGLSRKQIADRVIRCGKGSTPVGNTH
jgi:hypothetical protein